MVRISIPNIRVNINSNNNNIHPHPLPYPVTKLSKPCAVEKLVNFLASQRPFATALLTGAGVSVDSGIRPYRGQDGRYMNPNYQLVFLLSFISSNHTCRPILVSQIIIHF